MEVHVAKMKPPVIEPTIKVIRVTAARAELLSHRGNESADWKRVEEIRHWVQIEIQVTKSKFVTIHVDGLTWIAVIKSPGHFFFFFT